MKLRMDPLKNTFAAVSFSLLLVPFAARPAAAEVADSDRIKAVLPECGVAMTLAEQPLDIKLPAGMTGRMITVESESPYCAGTYFHLKVANRAYVGVPWVLEGYEGTIAQKIKTFAWERLHESMAVEMRPERSPEGMQKVRILQKSTWGTIPLDGLVDENGRILILGSFHTDVATLAEDRQKSIAAFAKTAPARGAAGAKVTIVEFSDFQCPSCKFGAASLKGILEKYGDAVRYVRVDLPLAMHAWAFPAALAGRAFYRQNPDAFWKYKDAVYDQQAELNTFVIDDFAKNFAEDHGLDMKRYFADLESPAVRDEILGGMGAAFSMGVQGTPTYLIDGRFVVGGKDGKVLDDYLAAKLGVK